MSRKNNNRTINMSFKVDPGTENGVIRHTQSGPTNKGNADNDSISEYNPKDGDTVLNQANMPISYGKTIIKNYKPDNDNG
jgi:hypothetical protein